MALLRCSSMQYVTWHVLGSSKKTPADEPRVPALLMSLKLPKCECDTTAPCERPEECFWIYNPVFGTYCGSSWFIFLPWNIWSIWNLEVSQILLKDIPWIFPQICWRWVSMTKISPSGMRSFQPPRPERWTNRYSIPAKAMDISGQQKHQNISTISGK